MGHALSDAALYVWAVGLLAAGQAATMTCTYAGQIIMGGCLQIKLAAWKRVAITRAAALGPSILVAISTVGNDTLYNMINSWLNVLQSVQLPFAMLPVLHFSVSHKLLGRFKPHPLIIAFSFAMALLVLGVNFYIVITTVASANAAVLVVVAIAGIIYVFLCSCMVWTDLVAACSTINSIF